MQTPVLYSWTAVRSGTGISITHSCGKVVGITGIGAIDGRVLASKADGSTYELYVPARVPAPLGPDENIGSLPAD